MSTEVQALVWKFSPHKGSTLIVFLALADWSDDYGKSWPSVSKLATKTRQSERNTQYCIRELEQDGYLTVLKRKETSSQYIINLSKLEGGAKIAPVPDEGVQNETGGVQNSAENLRSVAPNTLVIRQKEHTLITQPSKDGFSLIAEEPLDHKKKLSKKEIQEFALAFNPPERIPRGPWDAWIEMRIEKNNCPTPRAIHMAIAEMDRLVREGSDYAAILNKSTIAGYPGLYAATNGKPNGNGNGFHNGQQSRTNGSGATGHLLDHLPDADEIARRRKADDARLEARRNARGM